MTNTLNIKNGPHAGAWKLMSASGFGSDGQSAQYRRLSTKGQILTGSAGGRNTINLTAAQVAVVLAA